MTSSSPTRRNAKPTAAGRAGAGGYRFVSDRLGADSFVRRSLNKVFPDHWSFMLGEIALYSFIILLLTGVFLTLFFVPSDHEVVYNGSYQPMQGLTMSQAYASTLRLSFDVRGGLLMRQIHHWAALLFVGSMAVHSLRVFFTGAFRKPRELNWLIGVGLLSLGIFEGFAGYSLPDDLLSGTGLRIGYSMLESIPVVGTWLAMLIFGGEFPGEGFLHRLYAVHILLLPGLLLALISAHMMILWHQKHTQFPGPGRTESNVVGSALYPQYAAKGGGFFFIVFAMLAFLGGLVQMNPIWYYGPFDPAQVSAGSQPDFYMGFLEGSLRTMPGWELHLWGHSVPLNLLFPGLILPGILFTAMALYPFFERKFITKDNDYHHLLDRPRDNPVRTGIGSAAVAFIVVLMLAGGNDIIAKTFHISLYATTWVFRGLLFVAPVVTFWAARRIAIGLARKDSEVVEHGEETGIIRRLPHGEYVEITEPVTPAETAPESPGADAAAPPGDGVDGDSETPDLVGSARRPAGSLTGARHRLSDFFHEERVEPVSREPRE